MSKITIEQETLEQVANALGIETKAGQAFLLITLENAKLMDNKQKAYGPHSVGEFGTVGEVVMMDKKMERIKYLFKQKRRRVCDESLLDSFRDISNYAIIATMVETKIWPNE